MWLVPHRRVVLPKRQCCVQMVHVSLLQTTVLNLLHAPWQALYDVLMVLVEEPFSVVLQWWHVLVNVLFHAQMAIVLLINHSVLHPHN